VFFSMMLASGLPVSSCGRAMRGVVHGDLRTVDRARLFLHPPGEKGGLKRAVRSEGWLRQPAHRRRKLKKFWALGWRSGSPFICCKCRGATPPTSRRGTMCGGRLRSSRALPRGAVNCEKSRPDSAQPARSTVHCGACPHRPEKARNRTTSAKKTPLHCKGVRRHGKKSVKCQSGGGGNRTRVL